LHLAFQILGIILTTSGSVIAIESLWRKRIRNGIKYLEETNDKIGTFWVIGFLMSLFSTALGNLGEKDKKKKSKNWRKTNHFIWIFSYILGIAYKSLDLSQKLLKKVDTILIQIGVQLIVVGAIFQIISLLI